LGEARSKGLQGLAADSSIKKDEKYPSGKGVGRVENVTGEREVKGLFLR